MKKKEYAAIDLFKLIFSFFVVFIHCHPGGTPSFLIANGVGRLAVPFFFVSAGYFLAEKTILAPNAEYKRGTTRFLWRILKMYLIWSAVYLPLMLVGLSVGRGLDPLSCALEYLRSFLFLGSFSQLWYLPALFVGAALVALLSRKMDLRLVFGLALLFYLIGIFNEAYSGLCPPILSDFYEKIYNPIFERTRNGLFFAPVFVALGYLFAKYQPKNDKKGRDACLALLFTALMCVEAYLLEHYGIANGRYGMYLMALPAVFFCFRWAKNVELPLEEQKAYTLRKISTAVYLTHQFVNGIVIVGLVDNLLGLEELNALWKFFILLALTLPLSYLLVRAGKLKGRIGAFFRGLC